ncbi:hypothetical protein RJC98_05555 [Pseudomonas allii]|uniref:Uncharacterized protein n=2 Tax=Pseudomonas allii TaxID=2740531 RepID=A0ACC6L898_9PSED|nr:hypothetical protein [Pseudomonas allii]MDR9874634.1 hypothetical protein [Pseudomonas allii]NWN48614.1 hypothetical protein [Pseudomonas allii]NWN61061.1 hypothetical protein [Pseudomonas allii]
MFHLPPNGVLACFSQAVSSVHSSRVIARSPANILDARADLFFASSSATERRASRVLLKIAHNFGVRNATQQQMAGKLLP